MMFIKQFGNLSSQRNNSQNKEQFIINFDG